MATVNLIKAVPRSQGGKGAARAERRAGRVPGIIYGDGKPPLPISLDYNDLRQRIYAGHFLTTIHDVEIDGVKHRVIPRDFQLDAIRDLPLHVDFMRLGEGATIRVNIPIHVKNADQSLTPSKCAAAPMPFQPASKSMSAGSTSIIPST
jgi:large subunit ribosomal protein L25